MLFCITRAPLAVARAFVLRNDFHFRAPLMKEHLSLKWHSSINLGAPDITLYMSVSPDKYLFEHVKLWLNFEDSALHTVLSQVLGVGISIAALSQCRYTVEPLYIQGHP